MTRPIKFRAYWMGVKGEFTLNDLVILDRVGIPHIRMENNDLVPLDDEDLEIVEFTGLTDKNGKEIYEGDVVKIDEMVKDIIFRFGSFEVRHTGNGIGFYRGEEIEVIGNIYENSNLLNND